MAAAATKPDSRRGLRKLRMQLRKVRELGEEIVRRLRFGQMQPDGGRAFINIRWVQFEDAPHGARLLIRLVAAPNPGLYSFLAGNVGVDRADWEEVAVG